MNWKLTGMIAGGVVAAGLITWGVVALVKKTKKAETPTAPVAEATPAQA